MDMGKKAQVISRELLYIIAAPTAANGLDWIRKLGGQLLCSSLQ